MYILGLIAKFCNICFALVIAILDWTKDALESVTCGGIEILDWPDENEEDDYNMVGGAGAVTAAAAVVVGWVMLLAHKNKIYHQSSIRNKSSNRIL